MKRWITYTQDDYTRTLYLVVWPGLGLGTPRHSAWRMDTRQSSISSWHYGQPFPGPEPKPETGH